MKMVKKMVMVFLSSSLFLFIFQLGLTSAGQEWIQVLNFDEKISGVFPGFSHSDFAVSVTDGELLDVSSNVLMAETWLRTHVLAHYPSTKITTIVVGNTSLCSKNQDNNLHLVFLSLKNLFYSLTRWGLEKDIKISTFLSNDCFYPNVLHKEEKLRLLFRFIHSTNSTITLKLSGDVSPLFESMKKMRFLEFSKVNVIVNNPTGRKLSFVVSNSNLEEENGKSPNLFPGISEPPLPFDGFSAPPQSQASPPQFSFQIAPGLPPIVVPASPPLGFAMPPCKPNENVGAPIPQTGSVQISWCVAKPSVPAEILQQAMDYACGEGGADCKEISPNGNCYNPDSLVAHASYAFNSYWQKNKRNGGTCGFGGTAMIINSDPSFLHCRFVLS